MTQPQLGQFEHGHFDGHIRFSQGPQVVSHDVRMYEADSPESHLLGDRAYVIPSHFDGEPLAAVALTNIGEGQARVDLGSFAETTDQLQVRLVHDLVQHAMDANGVRIAHLNPMSVNMEPEDLRKIGFKDTDFGMHFGTTVMRSIGVSEEDILTTIGLDEESDTDYVAFRDPEDPKHVIGVAESVATQDAPENVLVVHVEDTFLSRDPAIIRPLLEVTLGEMEDNAIVPTGLGRRPTKAVIEVEPGRVEDVQEAAKGVLGFAEVVVLPFKEATQTGNQEQPATDNVRVIPQLEVVKDVPVGPKSGHLHTLLAA